jgi:hypothetical protein
MKNSTTLKPGIVDMPQGKDVTDKNSVERETRAAEPDTSHREDRAMQDRAILGSREVSLSDDERLDIFRTTFVQAALPSLPEVPGWHLCWCSTTNDRDTIPLRLSLGYVPVEPHEIAGWRGGNISTVESGELKGWVSHNEMVAMKIPMRLYDRYMQEAHHKGPAEEDQKLVTMAEDLAARAQSIGAKVKGGSGLELIKTEASVPVGRFG